MRHVSSSMINHDVDAYQAEALRTAGDYGGLPPLAYLALGLAGEAGEFADHIKKVLRDGVELDVEAAIEELGDIAWYVAVAAAHLHEGLPLSLVFDHNVQKLRARYPNGFEAGRSLARPAREAHEYPEAVRPLPGSSPLIMCDVCGNMREHTRSVTYMSQGIAVEMMACHRCYPEVKKEDEGYVAIICKECGA